jgi:hypothetical protein
MSSGEWTCGITLDALGYEAFRSAEMLFKAYWQASGENISTEIGFSAHKDKRSISANMLLAAAIPQYSSMIPRMKTKRMRNGKLVFVLEDDSATCSAKLQLMAVPVSLYSSDSVAQGCIFTRLSVVSGEIL